MPGHFLPASFRAEAAVVLLCAVVIALPWALAVERVRYERAQTIADQVSNNDNLALAFDEHTTLTLKSVDGTLLLLLRLLKGQEQLDIRQLIESGLIDASNYTSIGVVDAHGDLMLGSADFKPINFSDREWFQVHQRHATQGMFVGMPLLGRVTGRWTIPFSRRISKPDGSFGGVIYVAMDTGYFTRFYEKAKLGERDLVQLVGLDGIARARRAGSVSSFGQDMSRSSVLREAAQRKIGSYLSVGRLEGVRRFISYRVLDDYPLVVAVGTSQDETLREFYVRQRNYYLAAAASTVILLIVIGGFIVISTRQKRIENALRNSEANLKAAQRVARIGDWRLDLATGAVNWSEEIYRVFGRDPGLPPPGYAEHGQILTAASNERMNAAIENTRRTGAPYEIDLELLLADGSTRWIVARGEAVHDDNGRIVALRGTAQDITERKAQELKIARLSRIQAVLSGINSLIVRVRDRQELFDEACRVAVEAGGFGIVWIGMLNRETLEITPVACAGVDAEPYLAHSKNSAAPDRPMGQGVVGRAIREKRTVFSNDIAAEPDSGGERRKEAIRRGYRSVIALPLLVEGTVVGNLSLFAREANFFTADELKLLEELAGDISFALDHIGKEEKVTKLSRVRRVSGEINAAIIHIREPEALLQEICRIAVEHGKFELVWIALLDQNMQAVRPVAWAGFSSETAHAVNWQTIQAPGVLLAEVLQTRKIAVRNDLAPEARAGTLRREALKKGCRSTVCLPLVLDDTVVAAIILFATGANFFDEDELELLNEVAADVSFALQSSARQEKLNYLANYDALTGLPNRTLLQDYLGRILRRAKEEETKAAVLMCDVKRFRLVNETLGRQTGDALLRELGQRLKQLWPEPDNLARISADCFGGIVANIHDASDIAHLVEKLFSDALGRPFEVGGEKLHVALTVGIAVFPSDGEDADALLRNAEAALKKAKIAGERYLFYEPRMNAAVAQNLLLENRLRQALDKDQFVLHYQPKTEIVTRRIVGLEALIRWNDPETGLVPPAHFIPLLEETGLILDVGRWAIRKALAEHRDWGMRGLQPPRIAVNVSSIQLRQKDFVEMVSDTIAESKVEPHGLDLEITESLIMEDIEGAIRKLTVLRDMGVNIAIDDFGTGYSSLGYLARLPVNAVKIDRSFIQKMTVDSDSMAIVSMIISLAHSLQLKVIAEGVETEEQARYLMLLKCDEMQGYLFSKPLPAELLAKMIGERGKS